MPTSAASKRLVRLHSLLASGPKTLVALQELLEVSESTVRRKLDDLKNEGAPVREALLDDGKKVFSLPRDYRPHPAHRVQLTTAWLFALIMARNSARTMLRGTGFDDDLEDAFTALMATLSPADAARARMLDRKFYDRGEMPVDHSKQADVVDEITTALWNDERLLLRRRSSKGDEVTHLFDPYSLVTYKKGLYLVGLSHDKGQRISIGLDIILEATRQKGNTFECPADYDEASMFKGALGMFVGTMTRVVIRFQEGAARYVLRRPIHESQKVVATYADKSFDVSLDLAGTTELESLILSYGPLAEVRSPPALRDKMKEALKRALATYDAPPGA